MKPFSEILDLKSELKEYRRLCKQKSKKYTYYSEWKEHIVGQLLQLDSSTTLDDFKHYCIHIGRAEKWYTMAISEITAALISAAISLLFPEQKLIITMLIFSIAFTAFLGLNATKTRDNYFYSDIVDIIEELQKSKTTDK